MSQYMKSSHIQFLFQKEKFFFVRDLESNKIYMMNETCWFILSNINNSTEQDILKLLNDQLISQMPKLELETDIHDCIQYLLYNKLLQEIAP